MLDTLRAGAKSWISKLLIGLLVISFAIWGISGDLLNVGGDRVASVGDQKVSIEAFDTAYRRELDRIGRSIGRPLSTIEGASLGVPGQVLGRLIAEAALNQTAEDLNLGVTDEELVRLIQSAPAFQAPGGGFDRNRLVQILQANGLTEDQFVEERRALEERLQIAEAISGGLTTPQPMLEAFNQHAKEERSAKYIVLDQAAAGEIPPPGDEELTTYFEDNLAAFRAPEYRKIAVLQMTPDRLARPGEVSEDDVKREYEAAGDRFGEVEERRILQLTLASDEDADAVRQALAEGKSFEDIVAERGTTIEAIDLGSMKRADLIDPAIADAAFALEEGQVSDIVDGRFSPVVLKIAEITPARKTPYEEVADTLRQEIALRLAEREVLDLHDEIEDARAGGATLTEVAERFSLTLDTPPAFDTAGKAMDGTTVDLPDTADLISDTFESDVGIETDPLQLGRTGFVWFEVTDVVPARDRTLDEVREDVVAAWTAQQRSERLDTMAGEILSEVKDGKTLDVVAQERGLDVGTADGLRRNAQTDVFSAAAIEGVFSGPVGTTGMATRDSDGARIVFKVEAVNSPAFFREDGEIAALDDRLGEALQNSVLGEYVSERQATLGVSVNQANINLVIGQGGG
ncbi:SurA N-terminal domain-containing protein [Stappia stellulata]|uniref:SurA N-terminal domain-containing protein n=1 Tax=Stappia stellulata TaxID=71235 RepID=UPI001CD41885|nr:SurA N-terminal domain-containing protein [Stappia stellulata]MCA1241887.1 SurA N-terminal domain-containing protein [Stappia stellulata]